MKRNMEGKKGHIMALVSSDHSSESHSNSSRIWQENIRNDCPGNLNLKTQSLSVSKKLVTVNDASHSGGTAFINSVAVTGTSTQQTQASGQAFPAFSDKRKESSGTVTKLNVTDNSNSSNTEAVMNLVSNSSSSSSGDSKEKRGNRGIEGSRSSNSLFEENSCSQDVLEIPGCSGVLDNDMDISREVLLAQPSHVYTQRQNNNVFEECDSQFGTPDNTSTQSILNFIHSVSEPQIHHTDQQTDIFDQALANSSSRARDVKMRRSTSLSNEPDGLYIGCSNAPHISEHENQYMFQKQPRLTLDPGAISNVFSKTATSSQIINTRGMEAVQHSNMIPSSQDRCHNLPCCSFQNPQEESLDCTEDSEDSGNSPADFSAFSNEGRLLSHSNMTPPSDFPLQNPTLSLFQNDVLSTSESILMSSCSPPAQENGSDSPSTPKKFNMSTRKRLFWRENKQMSTFSLQSDSQSPEICPALSPLLADQCDFDKNQLKARNSAEFLKTPCSVLNMNRSQTGSGQTMFADSAISQDCSFDADGQNKREVKVPAGKCNRKKR